MRVITIEVPTLDVDADLTEESLDEAIAAYGEFYGGAADLLVVGANNKLKAATLLHLDKIRAVHHIEDLTGWYIIGAEGFLGVSGA